ncbi:hypothetical protein BDN72DRAFT_896157 [Pluteus cervinus]|uniref:Uncharacterized protein n=1 Tax=Pluteus cervinus TaxID=181527 RepID=A0ACD3AYR1_9AGAR|nr:hypothetical protein BDN72DRAFT_896157 [Pluteus cervinus]
MEEENELLDWGHEEDDDPVVDDGPVVDDDPLVLDDNDDSLETGYYAKTEPPVVSTHPSAQVPRATVESRAEGSPRGPASSESPRRGASNLGDHNVSPSLRQPRLTHALPPKPIAASLPYLPPSHPSIVEATAMASSAGRESKNGKQNGSSTTLPTTGSGKPLSNKESELPPDWEVRYPRGGGREGYFYNTRTHVSTWTRPVEVSREEVWTNGDRARRNSVSARDKPLRSPTPDRLQSQRPARPQEHTPKNSQLSDLSFEDRHYRPGAGDHLNPSPDDRRNDRIYEPERRPRSVTPPPMLSGHRDRIFERGRSPSLEPEPLHQAPRGREQRPRNSQRQSRGARTNTDKIPPRELEPFSSTEPPRRAYRAHSPRHPANGSIDTGYDLSVPQFNPPPSEGRERVDRYRLSDDQARPDLGRERAGHITETREREPSSQTQDIVSSRYRSPPRRPSDANSHTSPTEQKLEEDLPTPTVLSNPGLASARPRERASRFAKKPAGSLAPPPIPESIKRAIQEQEEANHVPDEFLQDPKGEEDRQQDAHEQKEAATTSPKVQIITLPSKPLPDHLPPRPTFDQEPSEHHRSASTDGTGQPPSRRNRTPLPPQSATFRERKGGRSKPLPPHVDGPPPKRQGGSPSIPRERDSYRQSSGTHPERDHEHTPLRVDDAGRSSTAEPLPRVHERDVRDMDLKRERERDHGESWGPSTSSSIPPLDIPTEMDRDEHTSPASRAPSTRSGDLGSSYRPAPLERDLSTSGDGPTSNSKGGRGAERRRPLSPTRSSSTYDSAPTTGRQREQTPPLAIARLWGANLNSNPDGQVRYPENPQPASHPPPERARREPRRQGERQIKVTGTNSIPIGRNRLSSGGGARTASPPLLATPSSSHYPPEPLRGSTTDSENARYPPMHDPPYAHNPGRGKGSRPQRPELDTYIPYSRNRAGPPSPQPRSSTPYLSDDSLRVIDRVPDFEPHSRDVPLSATGRSWGRRDGTPPRDLPPHSAYLSQSARPITPPRPNTPPPANRWTDSYRPDHSRPPPFYPDDSRHPRGRSQDDGRRMPNDHEPLGRRAQEHVHPNDVYVARYDDYPRGNRDLPPVESYQDDPRYDDQRPNRYLDRRRQQDDVDPDRRGCWPPNEDSHSHPPPHLHSHSYDGRTGLPERPETDMRDYNPRASKPIKLRRQPPPRQDEPIRLDDRLQDDLPPPQVNHYPRERERRPDRSEGLPPPPPSLPDPPNRRLSPKRSSASLLARLSLQQNGDSFVSMDESSHLLQSQSLKDRVQVPSKRDRDRDGGDGRGGEPFGMDVDDLEGPDPALKRRKRIGRAKRRRNGPA